MTPSGQGQVPMSLFSLFVCFFISNVFISIANWTVDEVIQTPLSQCIYLGKSLGIDISEVGWSLETFSSVC